MAWIKINPKEYQTPKSIKIGDVVVYKNGNGQYYKGKVVKGAAHHRGMLSNGRTKFGFIVDYGDIELIQPIEVLLVPNN